MTREELLVREFFAAMGPTLDDFKRNFRDRMTADVIWESVGLSRHEGLEGCVAYLDDLNRRTGMEYCEIEVLHMASDGDVVLSERIDTMFRGDGTAIMSFRIMGAIEVRDGQIARYTDYFDTASTTKLPAAPDYEMVAPPTNEQGGPAWTDWADTLPASRAMGLRCRSMEPGHVTMTMDESVWPLNPNGALHGGLVVAAADHCMGVATMTMQEPGTFTATASLTTDFHLPAFPPVTLEATVTRNGRTLAFVELAVMDASGRRCGGANGVWAVNGSTAQREVTA